VQYELVSELFMEEQAKGPSEVKAGVGKQGARMAKISHSAMKPVGTGGRNKKEMRKTVASQVGCQPLLVYAGLVSCSKVILNHYS